MADVKTIRTIGIGLMTLAAVAASAAVVWQRQEVRKPEEPAGPERAIPVLDLDQVRSAGL
ncbi:MAG: hypothetical protein ACREKN_04960 [Longimicrobiaceae bacterium]